jgi:hypothetical protein
MLATGTDYDDDVHKVTIDQNEMSEVGEFA